MKQLRMNLKGISLVALVITIIVLLILAGVTISIIVGDNGLFSRTEKATEESKISGYKEKIELIKADIQLGNEDYKLPNVLQLKEALEKERWTQETEVIIDNEIEKLKLITKEGYIFYITGDKTEYKGKKEKGEEIIVDTSALQKNDVIELKPVNTTEKGKLIQITDLSGVDYYKLKYQINGKEEDKWKEIVSGEQVELQYGGTIYAKLVYGSDSGLEHELSIDHTDPVIALTNINTSSMDRKTNKALGELFSIKWGSEGTGKIEYVVTGNLRFNSKPFSSNTIKNLSELELGDYSVKCTLTSPSGKSVNKTINNVRIAWLQETYVNFNPYSPNTIYSVPANGIYSEYDLAYYRDLVNENKCGRAGRLMNNITLNEASNWTPIGNATNKYTKIFDGQGYTIDNVKINNTSDYQGLFGYIDGGAVCNLVIGNKSNISGGNKVGGIAGYIANGSIQKCGNNATINATGDYIGGIVAEISNATIRGTYNKGAVTGKKLYVGGIVGYADDATSANKNVTEYCYNTAQITGTHVVAGIVGGNSIYGNVYNSYNTGTIISNGDSYTGSGAAFTAGITSLLKQEGECNYCYNTGTISKISGTGITVGGVCGELRNNSKLNYVYNSGNVSSTGKMVGGICGNISSTGVEGAFMSNSYISDKATVKYNQTVATTNNGKGTTNQLGIIVGTAYKSGVASASGISSSMPTVYYVVNSNSDNTSTYWSSADKSKPKLEWEK